MPSVLEKIRVLGENSKYDICASTASSRTEKYPKLFGDSNKWIGATASAGICHSYTPDGRCMSLFKTLYTNKCIYNCKYCFSHSCKKKMSFTPEEYARTFMKLYSMNVVEGVFISSAVSGSADETTEEMLEAIQLLRFKYNFRGYVHFKCLPGVSQYLLKEAITLSDRISINTEASTKEYLAEIAEQKDFNNDILTRQRWLKQIRIKHNCETLKVMRDLKQDNSGKNQEKMITDRRSNGYKKFKWDGAPILNSGQTTQFVVGAAEDETDYDLLKRIDWGYREVDLRRAYFSSFIPIEGTPLGNKQAASLEREHRLYQTDWLLRIYQYNLKDLREIITDNGNLPRGDPKIHLAHHYFNDHNLVDTPVAKKINHMMREVSTESYRAIQFTRTEINNRGVLYGVVFLKHRVIDLVLKYLHERFGSHCIICLYNEGTHKTAIMNEKGRIRVVKSSLMKIVKDLSENRPIIPYFDDIQFSGQKIFETLYASQFISERKNKSYFKKMIPDKCFELPGMRGGVEKGFRNKKINDFL